MGAIAIGTSASAVRSALGTPSQETITHGVGTAEWLYRDSYIVRLHGPLSSPGDVWEVIAYESSNARTSEGFSVRDTKDRFRQLYSGRPIEAFVEPGQDQLQVSDGKLVLLANFGTDGRASYLLLKVAGQ